MRAKKLVFAALALCTAVVSGGCWDSTDINQKALITLVITDKQDGQYAFYIELPGLAKGQQQEGGNAAEYAFVTGRGATFSEARQDLDSKMDYPIFLGTVRALVLTDAILREDFVMYMNRLDANTEYRKALFALATFDKPEDIIAVSSENNKSHGHSISDMMDSSKQLGHIVQYSFSEINEFLDAHICFVLPNIGIREGSLALTGYSVMHEGRYQDFIPREESAGLLFLLADRAEWIYAVMLDDMLVSVRVELKSRRFKPSIADGRVHFDASFEFESKVMYISEMKTLDDAAMAQIRQEVARLATEDIANTIAHSKSLKCDYLGFKTPFRIAYPNEAEQVCWCSVYTDSTISVTASTTLEAEGMMDFEVGG